MTTATVTNSSITSIKELQKLPKDGEQKMVIVWPNVIILGLLHAVALYGYTLIPFMSPWSVVWLYVSGSIGGFGVTGGSHRLWTHRSYKATTPLRIFLMLCATAAGQNTIYEWVRDHRVHHKFSETDADPHNAKRGFFFAHMGWLMVRKHPEVLRRGKEIDMSDILEDPVVQFQLKYFTPMKIMLCFMLPTIAPHYWWGETWYNCIIFNGVSRYVTLLNVTWLVNSAAHIWGMKPYDKRINPSENRIVSLLAFGEGWHNYHHTFPWDYKTAELGDYSLNFTSFFIDTFAKLGLAYDLKTATPNMVKKTVEKYGDGSHLKWGISESDCKTHANK